METKIYTNIELQGAYTTLSLSATDKLKPHKGSLKHFGHIEVSTGKVDQYEAFWDNLTFFMEMDYKIFKKECREDLIKVFGTKEREREIYDEIKALIKRAKKLGFLKKK